MKKYAKLYAKLKIGKGIISKNIKVKDHDFKKILYKATDTFVPLTDLLHYFWFYKSEIKKDIVDAIFSNVDIYFDMQEEYTSYPQNVEVYLSSRSRLISKLGNDIVNAQPFLEYDERELLDSYLTYFDNYSNTSLACYKMPIRKFKSFIEDYVKILPDDKFRINKKSFNTRLIIKYN